MSNAPKYIMKIFIIKHQEMKEDNYTKLIDMYNDKIRAHNTKGSKGEYPDSGFDLLTPYDYTGDYIEYLKNRISSTTFCAHLGVKCAMTNTVSCNPSGYYLYPRSSIVKTPFRLANSVGIIDSGYRGELMAVVDSISTESVDIKTSIQLHMPEYSRLFQICSPTLESFFVEMVSDENDLGSSERGTGGFGSTGL